MRPNPYGILLSGVCVKLDDCDLRIYGDFTKNVPLLSNPPTSVSYTLTRVSCINSIHYQSNLKIQPYPIWIRFVRVRHTGVYRVPHAVGRFHPTRTLLNWQGIPVTLRFSQIQSLICYYYNQSPVLKLERVEGIEPSHQPWQSRRLPLHHTRINWWTRQDSNLPHSACKADALPDELLARKMAEAKGAAPSVLFRARQFSKLL